MKSFLLLAVLVTVIFLYCALDVKGATFHPERYDEIQPAALKATPEEYKNKKIFYTSKYIRYLTTFPPYMEASGFRAGKYYLLMVVPADFPVLVRKDDEMNELIPTLPRGKRVKVYGKVKKFKASPQYTMFPRYYLELDHVEVVETKGDEGEEIAEDDVEEGGGEEEKVPERKKPWRHYR